MEATRELEKLRKAMLGKIGPQQSAFPADE